MALACYIASAESSLTCKPTPMTAAAAPEPRVLIRAFPSSPGIFGHALPPGRSAFEDVAFVVYKQGHQGCALSRWCGNSRLDKKGDPARCGAAEKRWGEAEMQ